MAILAANLVQMGKEYCQYGKVHIKYVWCVTGISISFQSACTQ